MNLELIDLVNFVIIFLSQALAHEKQGRATVARLVMKFRGYRRVKIARHPSSMCVMACDDYSFCSTIVFFLLQ